MSKKKNNHRDFKIVITKLKKCTEAFEIKGRGLVLGYILYTSDTIPNKEKVLLKLLESGREVGESEGFFTPVFATKHHRYDMQEIAIVVYGEAIKSNFIGKEICFNSPYKFWQPENPF